VDLDGLKALYGAHPQVRSAHRQRFVVKQQQLLANNFSKNGTSNH